jgi:hypothetical protein
VTYCDATGETDVAVAGIRDDFTSPPTR